MEEVFGEYFVDLKHFINCFMEMIMTIYLSKKSILLVSRGSPDGVPKTGPDRIGSRFFGRYLFIVGSPSRDRY